MNKQSSFTLLVLGTLLLKAISGYNAEPLWQWAVSSGGPNLDEGSCLVTDTSGNLYVGGQFNELYSGNGFAWFGTNRLAATNGMTIFLAKMDQNGNFIWAKKQAISDPVYQGAMVDMKLDAANNIYVASIGYIFSQSLYACFLAKYTPNGDQVWTQPLDPTYDCRSIALDSAGNIFVLGFIQTDNNTSTMALTKFDNQGRKLWSKTEHASTAGISMASDQAGNLCVGISFAPPSITIGTQVFTCRNSRYPDGVIVKYDGTGKMLQVFQPFDFPVDLGPLALDPSANLLITGHNWNTDLSAVAEYDTNCMLKWTMDIASFTAEKISSDNVGNVFIAGLCGQTLTVGDITIHGRSNTSRSAIIKLDSSGKAVWIKPFECLSDTTTCYCRGMTLDAVGNIYSTGSFTKSIACGAIQLTSAGDGDCFVAKLTMTPFFSQPVQNQAVLRGQPANLRVASDGVGPLQYQWQKGSQLIPGATNAVLVIPNAQAVDAGYYTVVVTNPFGSITSDPINLTVNLEGTMMDLYAGILIVGDVGKSYSVRYSSNLDIPQWILLTNVTLTAPSQMWYDPEPAHSSRRFYSVIRNP